MHAALGRYERLGREARRDGARVAIVSMYDVENNAVRLLAAQLRAQGHYVLEVYFKDWISNHLDVATSAEYDALEQVLRDRGIQLVTVSIRASAYYHSARLLTREIHERLDLPVLWGGMHPTVQTEGCIDDADLIIRGEGEGALTDLLGRLVGGEAIDDTTNLVMRDRDGEIRRNGLGPLVQDLDSLPFRDYSTHDDKVFIWRGQVIEGDPMHGDPVFQMMASRGCIYKCSFCYNSTYKKDVYPSQKWYRVRSVDSTLDEIEAAQEHWRFKRIRFDDEVFNPNAKWLEEFCAKYPRRIGLPFEIFIEPKLVDEDKMRRLRDAGLTGVFMGIQASERVTGHLYDRRVKNSSLEDISKLFHRLGIYPHYQLIFDDPASTDGDRRALFEMIADFPQPYDLYLFSMTVFPGSELNKKLLQTGVITPYDVEGENVRTFFQHRVNLKYPRPVEETFWISLIIMLNKGFVPTPFLRRAARSNFLKKHPWPLIQAATAANYVKMGSVATKMAVNGEMTKTLMRRWLSFERQITA